jgi:hypothetical protein
VVHEGHPAGEFGRMMIGKQMRTGRKAGFELYPISDCFA